MKKSRLTPHEMFPGSIVVDTIKYNIPRKIEAHINDGKLRVPTSTAHS